MLIGAVLPPLVRELELPDWTSGAIFSLSAFIWVFAAPYWGAKSNVWGRRPVAALGMAAFSVSMLLLGVFSLAALMGWLVGWVLLFVALLVSRALFGLIGSAVSPAAQAYVADRTSREERMDEIATLNSGFTLGQMVGPAAASVLISVGAMLSPTVGLLSPLFLTALLAGIAAWVVLRRLPENRPPQSDAGPRAKTFTRLWRSPRLAPFLIYGVGLSLVTGILTQTFAFVVMDRLKVLGPESAIYTGPALTMGAMATLISQLVLIPRVRMSIRGLMLWGAGLLCLGSLLLVFAGNFAQFAFAQILLGFGQGLARPGFSGGASLASTAEEQGESAGLVAAANSIGYVVSPFIGFGFYAWHSTAPFAFCAVVLAAMGIYSLRSVAQSSDLIMPRGSNEALKDPDPGL
jgi:MFS family permease